MNLYRKRFDTNTIFPFECVYHDTKSIQNELPNHIHDWFELVYIYRGKGTFFVDQTIYSAEPGDVFLIPGNTIHYSLPDEEDPKTSTALFFNPSLIERFALGDSFSYMNCFEQAKRHKVYKISTTFTEQKQIISCMESIQTELNSKQSGFRHSILLLLQNILLTLGRRSASFQPELDVPAFPSWMSSILTYIDEHTSHPFGMSELAQRASVSPAHFSRVFKKWTGMNVTEYITTKRILRSKELLLESDENIARIAEQCGYESLPHFHRLFKKHIGMTPAQYKKNGIKS